MKIWAEIYKSTVIALHQTPDDFNVVFSPMSFRFAKDITNVSPQPESGWSYNFATDTFAEPEIIVNRLLSNIAFWNRFTAAEQENITDSTAKKVKWFLYHLRLNPTISLEWPALIGAVNAAEAAGLIGVGRASEILA